MPGTVFRYKKEAEYLSYQQKWQRAYFSMPKGNEKIIAMGPKKNDIIKKDSSSSAEDNDCHDDDSGNIIPRNGYKEEADD